MNKRIFLILILFFNVNLFSADYDDDAAKVDFYVPGILANDGVSQVNFLLCFLSNTNFGTFANAGPYKALIDEVACESADGTDAAAEQQAATGGSVETETDSAGTLEEVTYSPGILNVTSDANGAITGNGWFNILIEMGPGDGDDVEVASTAYTQTVLTADKNEAAGRPYGNFTMTYEIKTDAAVNLPGGQTLPAGTSILNGYLDINGTTIKYYEDGPNFAPRSIMGDVANNKRDGYMLTNVKKYSGNNLETEDSYQARYKLYQDDSNGIYCQLFDNAVKYTQTAQGLVESSTTYADSTAFAAEIAGAFTIPPTAQLNTEGGTIATITEEHCWNTTKSSVTRQVYQYGTYLNSSGAKYDLKNTSLSLEANTTDNSTLTRSIHAHASYHGTHVRDSDKANVTDTTVFKNQRNSNDTDTYNLKKNYYQVFQKSSILVPLNQLDGVGFQWHVGGLKNHPEWKSKIIESSGLNWPSSGNCNAAVGNCPEYSGKISVNGSTVTFTATHGMDWNAEIKPFKLDTALTFTAANWVQYMTNGSGWTEDMHFYNPDSREEYQIPYAAFQTISSSLVRIKSRTKVDITSLEGKTFLCVERCLGATNLNSAIAEAFSKVDDEANAATLEKTPYVNNGPYFKVDSYYDGNGNGDQDSTGETSESAGRYNDIGGVVEADLSSYTVTNGVLVGANAAGGDIAWTTANADKLNLAKYRDGIRKYRYKSKEPTYTVDNWTDNFGHSFRMNAIEDSNKTNIKCEVESGNSRGYTDRYRNPTNDASLLVTGDSYYCSQKIRDGSVTSYTFELTKRPEYRIFNVTEGLITSIDAPKSYEYTVPSVGISYNFPGVNLAGNVYTLTFEGFGELHNIPGRVYNTCTGAIVGRYVDSWNQCFRFISEFTLPDGAILLDKTGTDDIKVRALRGDEYLKKLDPLPGNRVYTKTFSDLPTSSNLATVSTIIGSVPTTGILNSGNASVIHGDTVAAPNLITEVQ